MKAATIRAVVDFEIQDSKDANDTVHTVDRVVGALYARLPLARRRALRANLDAWETKHGEDHPRGVTA